MDTKNIIITGATSGIGKETALALAKLGHHIICPVRNIVKGENLKNEIIKKHGQGNVTVMYCDLACLDSVRAFANSYISQFNRLDILINNAGVWYSDRELTVDGYEKNFAINHLAPFLLTNLLLELLIKTPASRIINVASEAHKFSDIVFEDLQFEKKFNNFKAYGQSKLANILFTFHLSKLLANTDTYNYCLHPGVVATNLFNKMNPILKRVFNWFMISPQKGAATTIYLATEKGLEKYNGGYFKNKKIVKPNSKTQNIENAEKLWATSKALVNLD